MEGLQPLLLLLLVAAAGIVVVQSLRLARQRRFALTYEAAATRERDRRVAHLARSARATAGESDASALLEDAGYRVLSRQVAGSWTVEADGEPQKFDLRADYLVAGAGRRYIAEVKTGRRATRLSNGATRRQLLEYWAAFEVDGVLLVDADLGTITHVEVDPSARFAAKGPARGRVTYILTASLLAFVLGVVVGVAIVR